MKAELHRLLRRGRAAEAAERIRADCDCRAIEEKSGNSTLHAAVLASTAEVLELLLLTEAARRPDAFHSNRAGQTALDLALLLGERQCVHVFLRQGLLCSAAAPEATAASLPAKHVLALLLRHGGDVNARSERGGLLHVAVTADNDSMLQFLCEEEGIDCGVRDAQGRNAVQLAAALGRGAALLTFFERACAEPSPIGLLVAIRARTAEGDTLGHLLAAKGDTAALAMAESWAQRLELDLGTVNARGLTCADLLRAREEETARKKRAVIARRLRAATLRKLRRAVAKALRQKADLRRTLNALRAAAAARQKARDSRTLGLLLLLALPLALLLGLRWQGGL